MNDPPPCRDRCACGAAEPCEARSRAGPEPMSMRGGVTVEHAMLPSEQVQLLRDVAQSMESGAVLACDVEVMRWPFVEDVFDGGAVHGQMLAVSMMGRSRPVADGGEMLAAA
ncbi:MAG: hypothetical protein AAGI68_03625 [Planctomycetota bacterium]